MVGSMKSAFKLLAVLGSCGLCLASCTSAGGVVEREEAVDRDAYEIKQDDRAEIDRIAKGYSWR